MFILRLTHSQVCCGHASLCLLQSASDQSNQHSKHCPAYGHHIEFSYDGVLCRSVGMTAHLNHYCLGPNELTYDSL